MVDHPCKGLTKAQREAFERVATNQHPGCAWPTIDVLLKAGVIERGPDDMRRDALGVYAIPRFHVPIPVHHQWCAWCAENHNEAGENR